VRVFKTISRLFNAGIRRGINQNTPRVVQNPQMENIDGRPALDPRLATAIAHRVINTLQKERTALNGLISEKRVLIDFANQTLWQRTAEASDAIQRAFFRQGYGLDALPDELRVSFPRPDHPRSFAEKAQPASVLR
jgi:hypothetical protein